MGDWDVVGGLTVRVVATCKHLHQSPTRQQSKPQKYREREYVFCVVKTSAKRGPIHLAYLLMTSDRPKVLRWAKTRVLKTDTRVSKRAF